MSHLLQPLDVSCFAPLKRAYGHEVQELARQSILYIDKVDFLSIYVKIRPSVFNERTVQSGFQATGLVPANRQRVLSSLTVVNTRTPSPPTTPTIQTWTSETPHNINQLDQQARLLKDLLQRQSQSPSQAVNQLIKGCQLAMHSAVIVAKENIELRAANQRRQQKQQVRRTYIARGGALTAEDGQRLAREAEIVEQQVVQQDAQPRRQRAPPTCSKCHVQGHKRTQCTTIQ